MRRTRYSKEQRIATMSDAQMNARVALYSELLGRAQLQAKLGYQYDGNRDIYKTLGYDKDPEYADYYAKYERHDIAKAIINRPIKASWRGRVRVEQSGIDKDTPFDKAWKALWKRLKLKTQFIRLDKLASLGQYGILLFGFDDVRNRDGWKNPVRRGQRRLNYVRPVSQDGATIAKLETNSNSPRHGQPKIYRIKLENANGSTSMEMDVHYSRVLHVPGELLESDVYGKPALKSVYNRLYDLEKIVGGSAEMFWRGARPGYQGEVDKDFTLSDAMKQDLENQLDEFENNFRRFLINEGVKLSALEMQVAEPQNHVLVQLQMISADTGIPIRILIGSERGELASTEDKTTWLELVQTRQEDYIEAQILDPFIEQCLQYGILPPLGRQPYEIVWPDLFSPSEKERAEIGKTRAGALQSYMNNPKAPLVIPPEIFIEFFLGLTKEEQEHVKRVMKTSLSDVVNMIMEKIDQSQQIQPQSSSGDDGDGDDDILPTIHKTMRRTK